MNFLMAGLLSSFFNNFFFLFCFGKTRCLGTLVGTQKKAPLRAPSVAFHAFVYFSFLYLDPTVPYLSKLLTLQRYISLLNFHSHLTSFPLQSVNTCLSTKLSKCIIICKYIWIHIHTYSFDKI